MGIREILNKNPAVTTGGTVVLVLLALAFIIWELKPPSPHKLVTSQYFCTSDGQTIVAGDVTNLPPWNNNGQELELAYVYSCGGGPKFVSYMMKYTDAMKATLSGDHGDVDPDTGSLVKKPADKDWVPMKSAEGRKLMADLKCPDGTRNGIQTEVPPAD